MSKNFITRILLFVFIKKKGDDEIDDLVDRYEKEHNNNTSNVLRQCCRFRSQRFFV